MDHAAEVKATCREIDRCNQRGGRMLSLPDLVEAGTLDLELAARLADRVAAGASFMVGARPGGAGKTTVMGALLGFHPPGRKLVAATHETTREARRAGSLAECCYVCHEISPGPYFAYLWDADLRAYCELGGQGAQLATNLHADTPAEARGQVCGDNGVPEEQFDGFDVLAFLRVRGGFGRGVPTVESVHTAQGGASHRPAYEAGRGLLAPFDAETEGVTAHRDFLARCIEDGVRTIGDTRARYLAFREPPGC